MWDSCAQISYFCVPAETHDLEWTKHINATSTKANSKLSFLRCNLKGCPQKNKEIRLVLPCKVLLRIQSNCLAPPPKVQLRYVGDGAV